MLQDRAPPELEELLRIRQANHLSVAGGEVVHTFGRLDPAYFGTRAVLAPIRKAVEGIPAHRLPTSSVQAIADACIVTGVIARPRGLPKIDRQPFVNDATLFLQALESGFAVVSRNSLNMDLIGQFVLTGRGLLYQRV